MINKVRVYGKAQNRTALGIVNAYIVINPQATLADLQQAFPTSLNPDSGWKINFLDLNKLGELSDTQQGFFFTADDEVLALADGTKVALVKMWTKPSFECLVQHAAGFGIEVAEFTAAEKGLGKKGGYRLEYLNGFTPVAAAVEKKKSSKAIPILIILLILAALAAAGYYLYAAGRSGSEPQVIVQRDTVTMVDVRTDTLTIVKTDTVYVQQVEEIEKNFNAAQFQQGKAELNEKAKFALHDLAKLMQKHEELKVSIVGHTSAEGAPDFNQKLSEARAKAAVDFLVREGVDESRLRYEGKGSSEPIDPDKPELNRRTEFVVE